MASSIRLPMHGVKLVVALAIGSWALGSSAHAADPAFVGVLAMAVEPDVAEHLALSAEVQEKLAKLIEQRESEVQELALNKELPAEERTTKLAQFVAESEKQGLALLSDEQRTKLSQIRIAKLGMMGLSDPKIAESIGITRVQQLELNKIIGYYQTTMATGSDVQKRAAKATYEKMLVGKLTPEQRAAWEKLAGSVQGLVAQVDPAAVPSAPAAGEPAESPAAPGQPGERSGPGRSGRSGRFGESGRSGTAGPAGSSSAAAQKGIPAEKGPDGEVLLRFNFSYAPWQDVIDWFATQADLSFTTATWPKGTFNYTDNRQYTPEKSLDIINSILLTEGYVLVRRERMLKLFNLEDGPVNEVWVPFVKSDELDKKGEFELVKVLYQLGKMTPEEAELEVTKLKGPLGSVIMLSKARQIVVIETAGKQRMIRSMIQAIEDPLVKDERIELIRLTSMLPTEFMAQARPLLGIPELATSTPDGSIKISVDDLGMRLIVTGKASGVDRVKELVKLLEEPVAINPNEAFAPQEQSQLRVYTVTQADPATVLAVLQTLLAQYPDVRVQLDAKTGNLIALARPTQHATIVAIIEQLQGKAGTIEVFKLRRLDPAAAVLSINKLFGDPLARDPAASTAPRVDADPIGMTLSVKGTPSQIAAIRDWLEKMGEITTGDVLVATERSHTRFLALPNRAAADVLQQAETIFRGTRPNNLRFVFPSSSTGPSIPARDFRLVPDPAAAETSPEDFLPFDFRPEAFGPPREPPADEPAADKQPAGEPARPAPVKPQPAPALETQTGSRGVTSRAVHFVVYEGAALPTDATGEPVPLAPTPATPAAPAPAADAPATPREAPAEAPAAGPADTARPEGPSTTVKSKSGAEIVITATKNGIVITSEDLDALDEFEKLVRTLGEPYAGNGKEFTVYYLKFAKAEIAASLLQEMLTGAPASTGEGNDRGIMGDVMSNMMGDVGGGMMGALLGLGGGAGGATATAAGPVTVIPDPRLNALVISASQRDLDMVEQLLKVIDQPQSPDPPEIQPRARSIPVFNNDATDVSNTIKQVFAGRIMGDSGGQQRGGNPQEEFLRAMMGGGRNRGGRGGSAQANRGEEQKMTIGVDTKSNSLIVAAPDYLFDEVKALVEHLDDIAVPEDQTVRVVTLKRASSDLVQKSLAQRLGTSATIKSATIGGTATASTRPTSTSSNSQPSGQQGGGDRSQQDQDQMRQRMEMYNAMRGMGGGDSGRGGGFPGGGFPGGGFQGSTRGGGFPGGGFPGGGFPGGGSRGGGDSQGGGDRGGGDRGGGDRGGGDRGGRGR